MYIKHKFTKIIFLTTFLVTLSFSQSNYDQTIINGIKFELFTDTTNYSRGSQEGMVIHERISNLNSYSISITFINQHKINYEIYGTSGLVNYFPQSHLPMTHTFNLDSGEVYIETFSWDMKDTSYQFVSPGPYAITSYPDPHSPLIYNHNLSINVIIDSSWFPIVSALADPVEVDYNQPMILDLDNYVVDNDDPDSSLTWQILDSPGINTNINSITHELELYRLGNYAAFSSLKLKVIDPDSQSAILTSEVHLLPPNDHWNLENQFFLPDSTIKSISVKPPYLFSIRENQSVNIYDISIPDTLVYLSSTDCYQKIHYAKNYDSLLLIAGGDILVNNILIYDISNPLIYQNEINESSHIRDYFIKDSMCFVLKSDGIIKFYDISDISNINQINSISTGTDNNGFFIENDLMIILGNRRILIYSISNPINPNLLSEFQCQFISMFEGIFKYNNKLHYYGYDEYYVIDISDIYNPVLVSETSQFGLIRDYFLSNNLSFIANNYGGVKIFDLSAADFFPYIGLYKSNNTLYSHIDWIAPFAYSVKKTIPTNSKGISILRSTNPALNIKEFDSSPKEFQLFQNYPNPFNSSTTIKYTLLKPQHVKIEVFNILGQRMETLINQYMLAGSHEITWNGYNSHNMQVSSGIYYCRMQTGQDSKLTKMILLK